MACCKAPVEVLCDWSPAESGLDEMAESLSVGEAICTKGEVINLVHRSRVVTLCSQKVHLSVVPSFIDLAGY
jgi:hypothetical protein